MSEKTFYAATRRVDHDGKTYKANTAIALTAEEAAPLLARSAISDDLNIVPGLLDEVNAAAAKADAEKQAQVDAEAAAKAEAEKQAQVDAEAAAKAEAEKQAQADADAAAKAKAEQKAQADAEAAAKAEAEKKAPAKAKAKG